MVADMDDRPVNILSRTCKDFQPDASFAQDGMRPQCAGDSSRRGFFGMLADDGDEPGGSEVVTLATRGECKF
jgi:hypothetical protein